MSCKPLNYWFCLILFESQLYFSKNHFSVPGNHFNSLKKLTCRSWYTVDCSDYLRYWGNFSERNMHCMGFWNVPLLELPRGSVACFRLIFCFSLFFIWNETTQFLLYLSQGIDREAINFLVFEKEMEKWRAYIWQYGTIELCNYLIGTYMYRVPRRHQHGAVFILIPVLWNYFLKNNSCKRNHIKLRLGKYFNILKFCYRIILDFLAFLAFCY